MNNDFEEEIRRLLESGNKIAAIQRYREVARVGLVEALAAVDSVGGPDEVPKPSFEIVVNCAAKKEN